MRRTPYGFELFESCLTCSWRTEEFLCNVEGDALEALDRFAFTNVAPQHSILFAEGESPRGVYLLCHGSVKLSIASGDGKTLIIHVARAGETLGLSSVVTGHDYRATAETLEPAQVKFIKRDDFLRLLALAPQIARNSCRNLALESENDNEQIRSLGLSHSASEKLAHLILSWAAESGRPAAGDVRIQMLMTHQDISQLIGTSRETVTRLLKEFRTRKLISIKGSTLTIHDQVALEALVTM
jgi:CRP/FNR family transcriptional regulator, cyclic AMP receptor protein